MAAQLTDAAAPPPAAAGGLPPMLAAELERTCVSFLEPAAFFVSWQGVLTLAYRCGRWRGGTAKWALRSLRQHMPSRPHTAAASPTRWWT